MRRPLVRPLVVLAAVFVVCLVLVGGLGIVVWGSDSGGHGDPEGATQSNLQTALTGTNMYYAAHHSYAGLDLASVGSITGLSAVASGVTSSGPHTVSMFSPNPTTIVLVALSAGNAKCFGVLTLRRSLTRPYFAAYPATARLGTYYFVTSSATASDCAAGSVEPAPATGGQVAISSLGFGSLSEGAG